MVRQQEAFTTLLQNWDKYKELLEVSQTSQGTAARKYAAYEQSLEYTQKQAKAAWEAVVNSSEATEVIKAVNNISMWVAKVFPTLMTFLPSILSAVVALAASQGHGFLSKRLGNTKTLKGLGKLINHGELLSAEAQQNLSNVVSAAITYVVGQAIATYTAGQTGGASHKFTYNGETNTVASSKRAQQRGGGMAAVWAAAIPVIGSHIGSMLGSLEAAKVDYERDLAQAKTDEAQKQQAALNGLSGNVATIHSLRNALTASESTKRDKALEEFLTEIYSEENAELRRILEKQLDEGESLYTLTQQIGADNRQSREKATQQLIIAQKAAAAQITEATLAAARYQAAQDLLEANLAYNQATDNVDNTEEVRQGWTGGILSGVAAGSAGGLAVGLTAAKIGGAIGSAAGPIGVIAGILIGGIVGAIAGQAAAAAGKAEDEQRAMKAPVGIEGWANLATLDEKIAALTSKEEELQEAVGNGERNEAQLKAITELKNAYLSERDRRFSEQDQLNELQIGLAFARASTNIAGRTTYLQNLTTEEGKTLGEAQIFEILADELEKSGGLQGYAIKDANGKYSSYFVDYARRLIRSENASLNPVLTGEAYTLNEAITKLYGQSDQFSQEKLQNFALALRTSIDGLSEYQDLLGTLTYADLLADTNELIEKFDKLDGVLGQVIDSTASVTEWMDSIATQYPDLINYMSDTPELIKQIVIKMGDLNNLAMRKQFDEYMNSTKFWDQTLFGGESGIEQYLTAQGSAGESALAWIRGKQITRGTELVRALNALPSMSEGSQGYADASLVLEALQAVSSANSDIMLRGDKWKTETQRLLSYVTDAMRSEVTALEAQREALEQVNKQRKYEVDLLNAQNKLQDALNEKKRVYRIGVGFVYEADQKAVKEAQKALKEVQQEKDISAITKQIETLNEEAARWETYWDTRTKETEQKLLETIWGTDNMDAFRSALFGGQSLDLSKILIGSKAGSLVSAIFGSDGQAPSWYDNTFGKATTDFETFLKDDFLVELIKQIKGESTNPLAQEAEDAFADLMKLTSNGSRKEGVTDEQWNAAIERASKAINDALTQGAIDEDWDYNQRAKWKVNNMEITPLDLAASNGGMLRVTPSTEAEREAAANAAVGYTPEQQAAIIAAKDPGLAVFRWLAGYTSPDDVLTPQQAEVVRQETRRLGMGFVWDTAYGKASLKTGADLSKIAFAEPAAASEVTAETEVPEDWASYVSVNLRDPRVAPLWREYQSFKEVEGWESHYNRNYNTFVKDRGNDIAKALGYQSAADAKATVIARRQELLGSGKAIGTMDLVPSLINELGTEAIITPAGTLTALPSHTGIVPADITKNLWALGEVAPSLLRLMGSPAGAPKLLANAFSGADESININNLQMEVNADDSFDPEVFFNEIKQRVAVTRHTR